MLPADVAQPTGFLHTLLTMSLTAVAVLRPLYDATHSVIEDFAWVYLNAAGQRMLQQPEQPAASLLTLFPTAQADGVFAKCCLAYETGELQRHQTNYQADGLDGYFLLVAQRYDNVLVVNFTDTNEQPRTPVEQALRESQAREQAALAEAERQRQHLHHVLEQAPAMICIFDGPEHVFQFVNPPYQALVGARPLLGKPIAEAMPELAGQPIFGLLDQVYQTGETFYAQEMLVQLDHHNEGISELEKRYYNFIYQARRDTAGSIDGILVFAYEVTAQVQARQQVQQLNQKLEMRVQKCTRQVQQQSQRLARLVQEAPAAIALLDGPELVFELLNEDYQALFPERTLLGRPVLAAVPELADTPLAEVLQHVYRTGETFEGLEFPIPFEGPNGQVHNRYFDFIYQARYNELDAIDGLLVFSFDVTERVLRRQQTELLQAQLLAAAEQRGRQRQEVLQVLQQAPLSVLVLRGPTHVVDYINDYGQGLIAGREVVGQPLAEAMPNMLVQGFVALLDKAYHTGETQRGQEVLMLVDQPNGQPPRPYYFTFTYQAYEEDGQRVGVAMFVTDVTAPVLARQQTELLQAELLRVAERRAQERDDLYQVMAQTPVAVLLLREPSHRIDYCNAAFLDVFPPEGWAGGELRGHELAEIYPRMRAAGLVKLLDEVFATGVSQTVLEMPLAELQPGSPRYITFAYQPYREQGRIMGVAALAYDATEQVLARQQVQLLNEQLAATNLGLNTANTQLTHANADLDTFIYTASHDLRMPVANLEGLLAALRQELLDEPVIKLDVEFILGLMDDSIKRFQTTLGHLTSIIEQQANGLRREPLDLAALVEEVQLDLAPLLAETQAELLVDVQACPIMRGSPKDVRSILLNLLSNALKYRAPGRPARVQLLATCDAQWAELRVQDNGLGLSPAQQSQLFGLFTRLHDHVEGSGVGLYSIKRLIDNRGGTITVESTLGVGSTFRVRLPL
jgi:signal transduction histidine kinase